MWLELSERYAGSKLHHRDVVGVALRRMKEQLRSRERDEVVHDILHEVEHRKPPIRKPVESDNDGTPQAKS
jgi:hypothetical protein